MKILLTGATGYIGKRLLPVLIDQGYDVVCCVRDQKKFNPGDSVSYKLTIVELDLTDRASLKTIPPDIECAFYLVHSMSTSSKYQELEKQSAINFREALRDLNVRQVIYLSGIVNSKTLSTHLQSRKNVEDELGKGNYVLTTIRAGIIIGSGSASFEIIRDLVEKLPVMIAPRWLNTKCQPVAISDVIKVLTGCINNRDTFDHHFDLSGPETLTYKEMLMGLARVRGLRRHIWTVPVMTPRLSSYWLYFVTATSYKLAIALVDSMKVEVVAQDNRIKELLSLEPLSYDQAVRRAFMKIEQNEIVSSWKDSTISGRLNYKISDYISVPTYGCLTDQRCKKIVNRKETIQKIWSIGGNQGWYFANWLWRLRGFLDKLTGGVGLRRGRTNAHYIQAGDTLDFWRVLYANQEEGRLLLLAEMKLPGEAWLEFKIVNDTLIQTATFRPKGVVGRLYWYSLLPFHLFIFDSMAGRLV